jgi:glutamine cyclotransferase
MRRSIRLPAACLLLAWLLIVALAAEAPAAETDSAAPLLRLRVLRRLPHDPEAFTEGLALKDGALYESTGLYGASSVRRLDPESGRVLARADLPPRLFGEGLALCPEGPGAKNPRLIQLTWREGLILTYDRDSLRATDQARLRGQGWGLACRGHELVMSDGSPTLRWLDAGTLRETGRTLRVTDAGRPVERLNELEWVNGWLVANIWEEDRAAVIDPHTGRVAAWLDLAGLRPRLRPAAETPNGVAYDAASGPGELMLTGKRWDVLFVVELPELLSAPPSAPPAGRASARGRRSR